MTGLILIYVHRLEQALTLAECPTFVSARSPL